MCPPVILLLAASTSSTFELIVFEKKTQCSGGQFWDSDEDSSASLEEPNESGNFEGLYKILTIILRSANVQHFS